MAFLLQATYLIGCCQSCSGFAIQTVLYLLNHFCTWLKRQIKSFKIAFWRLSRVCGSVWGVWTLGLTRKEPNRDPTILSEMHSLKAMVPACSQLPQTVGYKENKILIQIPFWACHSQHKEKLPISAILPLPETWRPSWSLYIQTQSN